MKTNSFFKVFCGYIRNHIKVILSFFIFAIIFAVVFFLNGTPIDAILYGTLLSATLAFLFSLYDFFKFYKKHTQLHELLGGITVGLDKLPDTSNLIEKDYQNLLHRLHDNNVEIVSLSDSSRTNMIDYYTLWAHQIKTPIAAMSLLLQEEETPQNATLLQELFKIERYVELVLQYLRLESMSSDLMLEEYSLNDIVKQAVKKYAPLFIYKKIKLELSNLDCKVLTDEKWLVFVIEQILSNSLKYTHSGTISIYMDDTQEKTLVIEDTGIGIRAEDLPRVFENGFTGYNGRMDKKSTGIGLYLCRQIINKLSHKITITSEPSCGTTVKLNISREETFIE